MKLAGLLQVNCLTLLFAAHDTVASTLALLLRLLKQHPDTLQRLRAEQRQVSQPSVASPAMDLDSNASLRSFAT